MCLCFLFSECSCPGLPPPDPLHSWLYDHVEPFTRNGRLGIYRLPGSVISDSCDVWVEVVFTNMYLKSYPSLV